MLMHPVKIKVRLSNENLQSMVANATTLFFSAIPVVEDSVVVTRSEGEGCVNLRAAPKSVDLLDFRCFSRLLEVFTPLDDSYWSQTDGMFHILCVPIARLGVELGAE